VSHYANFLAKKCDGNLTADSPSFLADNVVRRQVTHVPIASITIVLERGEYGPFVIVQFGVIASIIALQSLIDCVMPDKDHPN